jgi:hypothetical protein
MEISMNRNFASSLTITSTAAAALVLAALASGNAYADDITIDTTPFVSSRTRAEVQAEVIGQSESLRLANSEWSMQSNHAALPQSSYTRAQAKADFIAARREVNALNAEDSGSSYLASVRRVNDRVIMAGSDR